MSEVRRRRVEGEDAGKGKEVESDHKEFDSEDDKTPDEKYVEEIAQVVPQGTDKTPEVLDSALKGLSARWRNWVIRGIFTWLMIGGFCLIIYGGPLALMVTTLIVQVKCFSEIINIGYAVYRIHGLPWFRSLSWYFLITSNYFFYGESLVDYFGVLVHRTEYLRVLVTYHRFISFCLYIIGFVWFVLSLVKRYYMKQFSLFAWTHVALFIVPVSMIVCNDVMAYLFGFFFGRTPLIQLSPKKTWEGFIGGGISTVIFGLAMSYVMCQYRYFVCPIAFNEALGRMTMDCEPSYLFKPQEYTLPESLANVAGLDFGDIIPGHGGIMDRFDCQYLMATFVYSLKPEEQVQLYGTLRDHLEARGLLGITA
ncbi:hypothetical protein J437_LFUL013010 [Ladona fulva]|uniref:phosphatidate cytidylyltransferase n=1 Tax=Ladona fulva TaxID=123851 RepID=A0A8K0KPG7_LADFU|nr:hypothetical protein J437_LFUL013010 [Ladona fulva]